MQATKSNSVNVDFDKQFLDRWLERQKYAWIVIAFLIATGIAGLLGRGPLSKNTIRSGTGGMEVKYERIARNKTPALLEVQLPASTPSDRPVRLRIEGELVKGGRLKQVVPQPVRSDLLADGFVAEFPTGSSGLIWLI